MGGGGGIRATAGLDPAPTTFPPQCVTVHRIGGPLERAACSGNSGGIGREPMPGSPALRKDNAMRDIQTTVIGNATGDPTEHKQDNGTVTAKVRIAVTGRYYNAATQDFADRKTEFITVFARRNLARNLLTSVRKGQPLVVTGRLSTSEWTAQDETQRHSLNIQAEAIGHDLTYGSANFTKPLKAEDVPNVDPQTGEVLSDAVSEDAEDAFETESADEDSYAPAF